MLRTISGWSKNSDEPNTYVHLSGETVRHVLLEKKGVVQKSAQEPTVIMCPRCGSPNEPDATLCLKCKSVLKLEHAVSISTVQKRLDEQNKIIEKMQGQIDMMQQGLVEKDRQYFELKRPLLKTLEKGTKEGEKQSC